MDPKVRDTSPQRLNAGRSDVVRVSGAAPPGVYPGGVRPQQPHLTGAPESSVAGNWHSYSYGFRPVSGESVVDGSFRPVIEEIAADCPRFLRAEIHRSYGNAIGAGAWALKGIERTTAVLSGEAPNSEYAFARRLRERHARWEAAYLSIAFSESEIRSRADYCSARCLERARLAGNAAYADLTEFAIRHGVSPPRLAGNAAATGPSVKRMSCPRWWRRQIRRVYPRVAEEQLRKDGFVHRHAGLYASEDTVARRREHSRRLRAGLESMLAVSDLGERISLAEIADHSVSNPKIRRAEH